MSLIGRVGDVSAYAFGTAICNVGDAPADWEAGNAQHPVLVQNFYRLEAGRFEQIGQSWARHGFSALQQALCCDCSPAASGQLGAGCSTSNSSSSNGASHLMGPRGEVQPFTGAFPFPQSTAGQSGDSLFTRLQVALDNIDPGQHPGARFFAELQVISADDASAGHGANNTSYREFQVQGLTFNGWNVTPTGPTIRGAAALTAWASSDPAVESVQVAIPGDGSLAVAWRVTNLGPDHFRYDYVIRNEDSGRGVQSLSVPLGAETVLWDIEFSDTDSHSGDPYSSSDWAMSQSASEITWSTTSFAQDPLANPIRWGTSYRFAFDSNHGPVSSVGSLQPYGPGSPPSLPVTLKGPAAGPAPISLYCSTSPNSVGPGALMDWSGTSSLTNADLILISSGATHDQFGLFFYGAAAIQAPFGDGLRCAGGSPVVRLPVQATTGIGHAARTVIYSSQYAMAGPLAPGSTWYFQFWYRDPFGPLGNGFNLSNGLRVDFLP